MSVIKHWTILTTGILLALAGCEAERTGSATSSMPDDGAAHSTESTHAHDHASEGPHGGHLVVLGDEAYHAEWVHDDASGQLTVFLLDAAMKNDVRTAAVTATVEIVIGEDARQHTLKAADPDQADPPTSSQFTTVDKPLIEALKAAGEGVEATLLVDIEGQGYRGVFEHHEHGHAH